jgi:hypothetical protein
MRNSSSAFHTRCLSRSTPLMLSSAMAPAPLGFTGISDKEEDAY